MQATLDAITEDLHAHRTQILVPKLESGLNEQQRLAFFHDDGPALVLAGAGSGKTTVLTRRVARLLARGVDPQRLFVATFTKKAAEEMSGRLAALLGDGGGGDCRKDVDWDIPCPLPAYLEARMGAAIRQSRLLPARRRELAGAGRQSHSRRQRLDGARLAVAAVRPQRRLRPQRSAVGGVGGQEPGL